MTKNISDRIRSRLDELGLSPRAASRRTGRGPDVIRNILRAYDEGRAYHPRGDTLALVADALDTTAHWLLTGEDVQNDDASGDDDPHLLIRGDVACGIWKEVDASIGAAEMQRAPVVYSSLYPRSAQFALKVVGTSINRIAADGDLLRCIDIGATGREPRDGDLVVVQRTRLGGHLREVTAKVYRNGGGTIRLDPYSDDPTWRPIVLNPAAPVDDEEIAIVAIVDLVFRPLGRL